MSVQPAREATFFGSPSLRLGWAAQLGLKEGRLQGYPGGAKVLQVVFRVGESTPFTESGCV